MWLVFCVAALSIQSINASYAKIQTLQGELTKSFTSGENHQTTVGKFCLKNPNKLFIRYAKPERTIVLNDSVLWVYLPADKKVIRKRSEDLSELEKHVLGVGSLLGLNPIQGFDTVFEFEVQSESTVVATPKAEAKLISRVVFDVDPAKSVILRACIFDLDSNMVSVTRYQDWEEIAGVWFPKKVSSETHAAGQELKEEHIFQGVKINQEVDESQFDFVPPEGTEIVSEQGRSHGTTD
jgi:outer membrane lipoprotein-sorting protein